MNFKTGLSQEQYSQNVNQYGLNQLPEKKPPSKIVIFANQFRSPLVYILALAGLATLALGDTPEAIGIFLVVVINSVLGFVQENKAEDTLAKLTAEVKPESIVIRDGEKTTVPSSSITVGDVVYFKLGDKIPADGILIEADKVTTNEAVLTGESRPIAKEATSENDLQRVKQNGYLPDEELAEVAEPHKVLMGTAVLSGIGTMLVTHVGADAKFGQIAESLANEEESLTPLQQRLARFSRTLTIVILIITTIIFVIGFARGQELVEMIELAISVAVSAIPEGLVIVLTIILTLGMNRILKRKALVRKLIAAETLGSVDTICVDKTGTLTEGKMKVVDTNFIDKAMAVEIMIATNNQVNSVEISILDWLRNQVTATEKDAASKEVLERKIFNSNDKYSAARSSQAAYFVGAPELILENSQLEDSEQAKWQELIESSAKQGQRLIAIAFTSATENMDIEKLPNNLTWNGIIHIEDPVRPNLVETFQKANQAGISIKVITGDIGETALAVLERIGIHLKDEQVISGKDLEKLSEEELTAKLDTLQLFYRTTPNQKLRIVKSLQEKGHTVAMMGDGINDTPALKRAEIGIVVDNATSFSKEVADMVLLDSNFKTIISAVEEGRNIFENMRKVLAYLLTDAFDALILVFGAVIFGIPTPLLPLQILYINFVADGLPDLALAFEKPESELMSEKPRPRDYPLLDSEVRTLVLIIGFVVTSFIFGAYLYFYSRYPENYELINTAIFAAVGMNSLVYIFSVRSFHKNIWEQNLFENKLLLWGVAIGFVSMIAAIYVPVFQSFLHTVNLTWEIWLLILFNVIADILIIEFIKKWYIDNRK